MVVAQAVAHLTMDREVMSLIPAGGKAFSILFSFLFLNQRCDLNQVSGGGATLLVFNSPRKIKNEGLAVQLHLKQAK